MEEVQGQLSLGEEMVPEVNGEQFVGAAESTNEVIFEGANGAFGSIAPMDMWWDQLKIDVLGCHIILEGMGCFAVQLLEFGA